MEKVSPVASQQCDSPKREEVEMVLLGRVTFQGAQKRNSKLKGLVTSQL